MQQAQEREEDEEQRCNMVRQIRPTSTGGKFLRFVDKFFSLFTAYCLTLNLIYIYSLHRSITCK